MDCCLPQLTGILDQYDSASELVRHAIDFGYVWAEQGQGAPHWLDKWQAVLELEDCHRLDLALDLASTMSSSPAAWTWPHTGGNLRSKTA